MNDNGWALSVEEMRIIHDECWRYPQKNFLVELHAAQIAKAVRPRRFVLIDESEPNNVVGTKIYNAVTNTETWAHPCKNYELIPVETL